MSFCLKINLLSAAKLRKIKNSGKNCRSSGNVFGTSGIVFGNHRPLIAVPSAVPWLVWRTEPLRRSLSSHREFLPVCRCE